jgi:hypothetical protein
MAHLRQKDGQRFRIQFTLRHPLFELYQQTLERAKKHRASINFGPEFAEWFGNQLEQINRELAALEKRQKGVPVEQLLANPIFRS